MKIRPLSFNSRHLTFANQSRKVVVFHIREEEDYPLLVKEVSLPDSRTLTVKKASNMHDYVFLMPNPTNTSYPSHSQIKVRLTPLKPRIFEGAPFLEWLTVLDVGLQDRFLIQQDSLLVRKSLNTNVPWMIASITRG